MVVEKRNDGISLISLIITIIVIIILAAIVIFSGMDTPEKAQLSKVISDIDNVQTAVDQAYYGLYTEKAVAGEVWTPSQFYEAVATGEKNRDNLNGTGLIEISENSLVDINLPKYEGRKWYIAVSDVSDTIKTGSAVLSPGFESQGKTYATLLDIQNGGSTSELDSEDKAKLATIQIGDYVNYMQVDGVYWRVIDKTDSGIVTLTTSDAVGSFELVGADGYINLENKLDSECKRLYTTNSAIDVRCMDLEDLKKLCRKYPMPNNDFSVENVEKMDIEELIKKVYDDDEAHARWIVYSEDTPSDLVQPKVINGHTYYPAQSDCILLTYDDENGNTHTATSFVEGGNGYRVPKYDTVNNKAEPVLTSWNGVSISIPSEITNIIGGTYSALASKQNDGDYCYVATLQYGSTSCETLYSNYDGDVGGELPYHPIVTINVKSLKNGDSYGGYNIWNVENSGSNLTSEKIEEQKLAQIQVGDVVGYTPDYAEYTTGSGTTLTTDSPIDSIYANQYSYWNVLYVDKSTGEILVVPNTVLNQYELKFVGISDYYGVVSELQNACNKLYSNKSLKLVARSLTKEDIMKACGIGNETYAIKRYAYYPKGTTSVTDGQEIQYNGNIYIAKILTTSETIKFYDSDGGGKLVEDDGKYPYRVPEENNPVYMTGKYVDLVCSDYSIFNVGDIIDVIGLITGDGLLASTTKSLRDNNVGYGVDNLSAEGWYLNSVKIGYATSTSVEEVGGLLPVISLNIKRLEKIGITEKKNGKLVNEWQIK